MSYKSYFTDIDESIDTYEAIEELLGMGYTIGEIEKKWKVSADLIVNVLNNFARNGIRQTIFEQKMERYDEKRIIR